MPMAWALVGDVGWFVAVEALYPDAGEAASGKTPVPQEAVTQIFNQTFHGPIANVASGHGIEQTGTVNIQQGDFRTLAAFLETHEVGQDDINDLKTAISSDPPPEGKKVSAWMGKMVSKSAEGGWKVATTVAGNLLTKALEAHYGMHP